MGVGAWALTYHLVIGDPHDEIMLGLYLFSAALIIFYLASVGFGRRYERLPVAHGRIVCVVPAYNEAPELLHATVDSLLAQTIPPDAIIVVDDGSAQPVAPFTDDERVHWTRQDNAGKRHAQANIWRLLDRDDWDYVLTVDSDSQPESDAVEYLLRAMSRPNVMAATGLILTRNWRQNLLTRIIDMNIGTSCLMIRTSRSAIGAVETTSGALALYRAGVVLDNLDDYISSGTNGDDRRLTLYALLRGDVVVVNEAVVHSEMPAGVRGTFRQRLRWGKSAWQALPFSVTNLSGRKLAFPLLAVIQWTLLPLLVGYLALSVGIGRQSPAAAVLALCAYLAMRYAETGVYLMHRRGMPVSTRLWHWLVLTPVEIVVKMTIIYPAKYYAIFKLRERQWHTRAAPRRRGRHRGARIPVLAGA